MEEWTRSLSGVLTVGVGLEQALIATLRSTPEPIRPEVPRLVARLRARWSTEDALRAFADELDDATGDLVAANLILGARRRGAGLASVLEGLAESVAADVRARRADRGRPGQAPRHRPLGHHHHRQRAGGPGPVRRLHRAVRHPARAGAARRCCSPLYVATLVWMRRMATGQPLPRFIGAAARAEAA